MQNEMAIAGNPSKSFFIDMITRDLSVTDCILDLIDNALDSAVEKSGVDIMETLTKADDTSRFQSRFQGMSVSITVAPDRFTIKDTCGGIGIEDARNSVFRFGNPDEHGANNGLSVYGIGMKRAFFKLGKVIHMRSRTDKELFEVNIDVDEWKGKNDQDWSFKFASYGAVDVSTGHEAAGTLVSIETLRDDIQQKFQQVSFVNQLRAKIAATYGLFIRAGLSVSLNGESISAELPVIATTKDVITSARKTLHYDGVEVLILAGVTPRTDKTPQGWYVFCNGRMVLQADKGESTGWGTPTLLPKWHVKFGHFVGYVYFKSTDARKLPWTTTKQNVVIDSPLYQTALSEMHVQSRPVLDFLNNLYPADIEPEGVAERAILDTAQGTSVVQLSKEDSVFEVKRDSNHNLDKAMVSIQYKKSKRDIDRIKASSASLRFKSARQIGSYTFDYYLKQECSE